MWPTYDKVTDMIIAFGGISWLVATSLHETTNAIIWFYAGNVNYLNACMWFIKDNYFNMSMLLMYNLYHNTLIAYMNIVTSFHLQRCICFYNLYSSFMSISLVISLAGKTGKTVTLLILWDYMITIHIIQLNEYIILKAKRMQYKYQKTRRIVNHPRCNN